MWGGLILLFAVLVGLAMYVDLTGPLGRFVDSALGVVVGELRLLIPLALAWIGFRMVREGDREGDMRVVFGSTLVALAATGCLHLVRGPDGLDGTVDELREGGGVVGALLAEPLSSLIASGGAWLVLVTTALFGVVIAADVTFAQLGRTVARSAGGASETVTGWFRSLVQLSGDTDEPPPVDTGAPSASEVIDLTGDDQPAPAEVEEPEPPVEPRIPARQLAIDLDSGLTRGSWKLPPMSILDRSDPDEVDENKVRGEGRILEEALASHGVDTRVVGMTVGPTVTRFELELAPGVKVSRVTSLHKDIAYAMASPDVRILAPIPGRSAIGVEVPNQRRQLVSLGDILTSPEAVEATHPLEVALGRDIAGRSVMANLATMPHLLIAGATGAGKSSCLNSILTSLLMRTTPDQVRLILVDPKRVEMNQYNRLPHLLTQVVTDPKKAANALHWAVKEMERRYDVLSAAGVRDITGYTEAYERGDLVGELGADDVFTRLPFIVVIVDELNDLMMVAARDVEQSITRLAQMARAVGIHLVVATQRPSVNVITGVIKANIPSRLAFAVSSLADSRVILDQPGAERLIGKGDMLLLDASSSTPRRIQGCWVTEAEVATTVASWRRQANEVDYVEGVEGTGDDPVTSSAGPGEEAGEDDDLVLRAMDLVVRSQLGSTSMLQRKLRIGFARAGRVMDDLEQRGVVGPSEGSKARSVLMTVEELEELQMSRGA